MKSKNMQNSNENKVKGNIELSKIKILVWGDSPTVATGFGTVIRGIFTELAKIGKYDIDIIGINDRGGWKDPQQYPFKIYPAKIGIEEAGDLYGRPRLIAAPLGRDTDLKPPWDIIFTLNDPFILEQPLPIFKEGTLTILRQEQEALKKQKQVNPKFWFKIISYWPIDSPLKGNWIKKAIAVPDYSVAYTQYGKKQIEKADLILDKPTNISPKIKVIYHGINLKNFYPLPKDKVQQFRKEFFEDKLKPDTFLIIVVARNQLRKDLPRTMQIFKEFQKRRPDSFLYFHCQESDVWGSLKEYARNWNLRLGEDWAYPVGFSANIGFPIEALNYIYNSADCILSTSLGEGFGFYNLEGFATKKIVIAPNNTTHSELFDYDANEDISDMDKLYTKVRGIPLKCGNSLSEWATFGGQDFERIRPLTNVEDAVKKLIWVYDNQDKVGQIVERAYSWVQNYTWENIAKQWDELFQQVYKELENERNKTKFNSIKEIRSKSPKSK